MNKAWAYNWATRKREFAYQLSNRISAEFRNSATGFELDLLERDPHCIFGLSLELVLIYLNPAWFSFARANGGEPAISERFGLGTSFARILTDSIRDHYLDALNTTLETGRPWQHEYQCSTPDRYRLFHQKVYPFTDRSGLLVRNSLVEEQPHDPLLRSSMPPDEKTYRDPDTGLLTQCINCRRTQRAQARNFWDWVPDHLAIVPADTSGGLCPPCASYFWESHIGRGALEIPLVQGGPPS